LSYCICKAIGSSTSTVFGPNLDIDIGRAAFRRNFYIKKRRVSWETCQARWNLDKNTAFVIRSRKTTDLTSRRAVRLHTAFKPAVRRPTVRTLVAVSTFGFALF
jgi:hypothetical protein